ncbi:metal ABC transporter substrate-binding protein [Sporomusa acidovorans]|uniref:High-affinity zinc uptake system binding-protein ZnuA n=1 Tax=Sporomusa acidovorans (strain ATCC 49682 / DSM 3132 / Mol) TaxID=1123286 RepID=A0ABZ3J2K5_SPOA4|nr:metal ABC transporter substrate-binding protein [Sporomusa acidovorans]OZC24091.1 high-affinity zinc uptake system binding-protein ZnuA precursor [Sporomusa acidovorans DSM 3132]SDF68571.1 zinc transport system substrate-binding protein [Sporomusa acidovorans]
MFKLVRLLSVLIISSMLLGGCGQNKVSESQTNANNTMSKNSFAIVTSFYPMYVSTINVTKGIPGVQVINMTKPQTGCLHDYQLTPEDLQKLEKANAFVVNGAGMEAFLDKVVKQQPQLKVIDASKNIELLKDETGEENPHVWVSISNAILQVKNIAEQLSAADPANAAKYKSNADEYVAKLEALRAMMHTSLQAVKTRDIITFHEAFPYFAKEFNLNIVSVIEREPGTEPSPKELEDTIEKVKELHVKALFAEPQYPAKAAQMISQESGAKVYTLDPVVTGEAKPEAYDDYINMMKNNLNTLKEALQ